MAHRAESIMAAVTTLLTGLTTTGSRVKRSRAWTVDTLPALTIMQGDNDVENVDAELGLVTRTLELLITSHVKSTDTLETKLNLIATEVFTALRADETLGLAYVFDIVPEGDSAPEIDSDLEKPSATQILNWAVLYEHSETSTES